MTTSLTYAAATSKAIRDQAAAMIDQLVCEYDVDVQTAYEALDFMDEACMRITYAAVLAMEYKRVSENS